MRQDNQFVCANCFDDCGLADFIRANVIAQECTFCGGRAESPIAADLDEVVEHIKICLCTEYDDAANQLPYEGREGGYWGAHWDTEELLRYEVELDFPRDNYDFLCDEIVRRLGDQEWCEIDAFGLNDEETARYSWDRFCDVIMHHRRFFFLEFERDPNDPQVYSPGEVLKRIFEDAQDIGLFKTVPEGTQLFRARWKRPNTSIETALELGPPPQDEATQSNRMSPPGIVMFYACDEEETALKETATKPGQFVVGRFETLRSARVLDLTAIPPVPSLFEPISDSTTVRPRKVLKFLRHIARQISRPIERDDRMHVEYLATQVVTEYVRSQLTWEDAYVDGIKYPSSVHPGHASYVIFATQDNLFVDPTNSSLQDTWLKLVGSSHRSVNLTVDN